MVRSAEAAPEDERRTVIRLVLAHARPVITGQRAWFAAQGWGSADGVPSMAELFGATTTPRPDEER